MTFVAEIEGDGYGLDGKTYGIMNRKSDTSAYGMLAEAKTMNSMSRLADRKMLIRTDPMNQSNTLYVAKDSDIAMWTFHAIEGDLYYMTTGGKYLRIDGSGALTLVEEPDENCRIRFIPGEGDMAGKVRLLVEAAQKAIFLAKENEGFYGANSVGCQRLARSGGILRV